MNRAIGSTIKNFSQLSYTRKFALITLIFLIPVLAFGPLISDQLTNIQRYGVSEQSGTIYLRSLWKFSEDVQVYVNVARKYSAGTAQPAELQGAQARVDSSFNDLGLIHAQYGNPLRAGELWEQIQTQWTQLKATAQAVDWSTFETNQASLFESIARLTALVGDTSYLILDPNLDTYYMMDAVLIKSPENQELIFETYQTAIRALQAGSFTVEERTLLIAAVGRLRANLDTMNRNIPVAFQNDSTGQMQQIVSAPLAEYQTRLRSFTDLVTAVPSDLTLADPASIDTFINSLQTAYEDLSVANSNLYIAASTSLELGIQSRINTLRQRLIWISAIVALGILGAFLIGTAMMRSISKPLMQLMRATERLSSGDMSSRVTVSDSSEIGRVGIAFNQMAEDLEREKSALITRSAELGVARDQSEKRARDLQTIAEISRIISSEHRLDVLLHLIAEIISEKLGFQHVGFFLLDDSRQFAILQATNKESVQETFAYEHRLKIGATGIISMAISSGRPQIALAGESNQLISQDEFLPGSRSELVLPIRLDDELIGALDIRSLEDKAFTFDNLEVFEVLASQMGIAIQNARLYGQNIESLKELEEAYRTLAGSSWRHLVQQLDIKAFAYDGVSSRALSEVHSNLKSTALTVPVIVRGQVVGNLRLNPLDPNRIWTEDDMAIARAVAERAALALEAARLLEDAQKRASREAFLSEMASKLSTSFQLDSILRDTVEELGQSLSGSTVSFQLVNPTAPRAAEKPNGRKKGAA